MFFSLESQVFELPEVSIVVPVFNGRLFLAEAIESVIGQTFQDWELILSDDGSSDSSPQVMEYYAKQDGRIRVLTSGTNTGPGAARNRGMRVARGRWLAFLDCDDVWLPSKLELTLDFALSVGSALTYTSYSRILAPDWRRGRDIICPPTITYTEMLKGSVINSSTVLVDRQLLSSFSWNEVDTPEDYIAWLGILKQGVVARGLQDSLSIYRMGHNSRSSNKFKAAREVFNVYRRSESLSVPKSAWYFSHYAAQGLAKHLFR